MKRYYYISNDLDDLEAVETELEDSGISTPQIHVLSKDDVGVEKHHLHEVQAFMKTDVVHATLIGALIGAVAATLVLFLAHFMGWSQSVGWVPFVFLAIVLLGFCTWEGGLYGIQEPNAHFRQFQQAIENGQHVFFVDIALEEKDVFKRVIRNHPQLKKAGMGSSSPHWIVAWQQRWHKFKHWAP